MKIVQDKKTKKWYVVEKQCLGFGRFPWVILSIHDTKQEAEKCVQ